MAEDPRIFLHFKTFEKFQEKLNDGTINPNKHFVVIKDEGIIWVKGKVYSDNNRLKDLESYYNDWEINEGYNKDGNSDKNKIQIILKGKEWKVTETDSSGNAIKGHWVNKEKSLELTPATESQAGLLETQDKKKLNRLHEANFNLSDPTSTATTVTINATKTNIDTGASEDNSKDFPEANKETAGSMSAEDFRAIDNLKRLGSYSHIKDSEPFTATSDKVTLNYTCNGGTTKDNPNSTHNPEIPVATRTLAGIITSTQKQHLDAVKTLSKLSHIKHDTTTDYTDKTKGLSIGENKIDLNYECIGVTEQSITPRSLTFPESTVSTAGVMSNTDKIVTKNLKVLGSVSHFNDDSALFSYTKDKEKTELKINYNCVSTTSEQTSKSPHSVIIPLATDDKAGIIDGDEHKKLNTDIPNDIKALDARVKTNTDNIAQEIADRKAAIEALDSSITVEDSKYIKDITITNGKISAHNKQNVSEAKLNNYSKGTNATAILNTDTINAAISKLENQVDAANTNCDNAIKALDSTKTSTDGINVQAKVTETDGKITAVNITTDNTINRGNIKAGTGIELIQNDGDRDTTVKHSNSITAQTTFLGDSSNQTPDYGSTFKVPHFKYDSEGHITAATTHTVKIPAKQTLVTGSANGTVSFDGTDVAVKGLGSNAYTSTSYIPTSQKGVASGVATLDANLKVVQNIDASKITSGTISIDRLPKGALERLVIVANATERKKLTKEDVQNGDTVKETDTELMYYVKDDTKLNTEEGWERYTAGYAAQVPWSGVQNPPSFAGSSSQGGPATSAVKLDTATAGSATQPVYFTGGKPKECTYSLNKTVPSDAKFTDTTYKASDGIKLDVDTYKHTNSITAKTNVGGASNVTPGYGSTFNVPHFSFDAQGHITAANTHTVKIPAAPDLSDYVKFTNTATFNSNQPNTGTNGVITPSEKAALAMGSTILPLEENGSHFNYSNNKLTFNYVSANSAYLDEVGTLIDNTMEIPEFVGATSAKDGKNGLVKLPTKADTGKYLKGDGTWTKPTLTELGAIGSIKCASGTNINTVGTPSVTPSTSGTETTLTFNYLKGAKGDKGDKGDTGTRGSRWLSGDAITGTATTNTKFTSSGITDALVNDEYLNTSTGNVYKCTTAGNAATATWVYTGNIKGTKGDKGNNGDNGTSALWFTGQEVTGTSTNLSIKVTGQKTGDMYLNTSTSNVYIATSDNTWKYVSNIKGATGQQGNPGTQGTRGSRWDTGTAISGGSAVTNKIFSSSGITDALVGDLYLNVNESIVYLCTTGGVASAAKWSYKCSIKGSSGTNATTTAVTSKTAAGLCPQLPNETTTTKYLRQDGTWAIPSQLQTARSLWGQSFNGTGNVSGNMTLNGGVFNCTWITMTPSESGTEPEIRGVKHIQMSGRTYYTSTSDNTGYVIRDNVLQSQGKKGLYIEGTGGQFVIGQHVSLSQVANTLMVITQSNETYNSTSKAVSYNSYGTVKFLQRPDLSGYVLDVNTNQVIINAEAHIDSNLIVKKADSYIHAHTIYTGIKDSSNNINTDSSGFCITAHKDVNTLGIYTHTNKNIDSKVVGIDKNGNVAIANTLTAENASINNLNAKVGLLTAANVSNVSNTVNTNIFLNNKSFYIIETQENCVDYPDKCIRWNIYPGSVISDTTWKVGQIYNIYLKTSCISYNDSYIVFKSESDYKIPLPKHYPSSFIKFEVIVGIGGKLQINTSVFNNTNGIYDTERIIPSSSFNLGPSDLNYNIANHILDYSTISVPARSIGIDYADIMAKSLGDLKNHIFTFIFKTASFPIPINFNDENGNIISVASLQPSDKAPIGGLYVFRLELIPAASGISVLQY